MKKKLYRNISDNKVFIRKLLKELCRQSDFKAYNLRDLVMDRSIQINEMNITFRVKKWSSVYFISKLSHKTLQQEARKNFMESKIAHPSYFKSTWYKKRNIGYIGDMNEPVIERLLMSDDKQNILFGLKLFVYKDIHKGYVF